MNILAWMRTHWHRSNLCTEWIVDRALTAKQVMDIPCENVDEVNSLFRRILTACADDVRATYRHTILLKNGSRITLSTPKHKGEEIRGAD